MGLGSTTLVSLQEARRAAMEQRRMLLEGRDPITARLEARSVGLSFGECADALIESQRAGWKNDAQADQWTQSLRDYGPDRDMPVADIDTVHVMACLQQIWTTKTETASRLRARIERVLDWAKVHGHRQGDNPARWRGHLDNLLPRPSKVHKPQHHAAMPYGEAPAFMARLRERDARSRRALQFTILTAARTEEVTGSSWDEFDLDAGIWSIPAERMKGGRDHFVPLSTAALAILRGLDRKVPPSRCPRTPCCTWSRSPNQRASAYRSPCTASGRASAIGPPRRRKRLGRLWRWRWRMRSATRQRPLIGAAR